MSYNSHIGRFVESANDYKWDNPAHWVAAGTHVFTQGFGLDPAIRDAARGIDGDTSPIEPYGQLGRLREDVFGAADKLLRLKPLSAAASLINIPGDAIADAADLLVDVDHKRRSTHSDIEHALAA